MGKHLFYNICLSCHFFAFKWPNTGADLKKYSFLGVSLFMSNNFSILTFLSKYCQFWRTSCLVWSLALGLDTIHFRILTIARLRFSNVLGWFFRLKSVSLLGFAAKTRAGSCISPRAVAFQSKPDAKNRPALKGSSANQIASFWLIKNNETVFSIVYLTLIYFCTCNILNIWYIDVQHYQVMNCAVFYGACSAVLAW